MLWLLEQCPSLLEMFPDYYAEYTMNYDILESGKHAKTRPTE